MKMFVVGGGHKNAFTGMGFTVVDNPLEADIFQFMGGEDVTPELYGGKNTNSYNSLSRDIQEMGYFMLAKKLEKPCVGICRGGQFLNVMCGGEMIQDIGGHTNNHPVRVFYGKGKYHYLVEATSTHHQMMVPGIGAEVLGTAPHDNGTEIILYEDKQCLCFQPHPEYFLKEMPELTNLYIELINYYFG